ncbi:MAG: hypothetical protein KBT19_05025 [Lachnospiraceae bacterium]|nr:hypothetical protein [Candidatus Colinaster equi]
MRKLFKIMPLVMAMFVIAGCTGTSNIDETGETSSEIVSFEEETTSESILCEECESDTVTEICETSSVTEVESESTTQKKIKPANSKSKEVQKESVAETQKKVDVMQSNTVPIQNQTVDANNGAIVSPGQTSTVTNPVSDSSDQSASNDAPGNPTQNDNASITDPSSDVPYSRDDDGKGKEADEEAFWNWE